MRQWRRYLFILIVLFLLIGITSVNYAAIFYLFLGFLIAYLIPKTISLFKRIYFSSKIKTIILVIIISLLLLLGQFLSFPPNPLNISLSLHISEYYIFIKPQSLEMQKFIVEYKFQIDQALAREIFSNSSKYDLLKLGNVQLIYLKEDVIGKNQGLILKELSIFPLSLDSDRESQLRQ
ncbi:hypothetical protein JYQ62_10135 [Nostoc sp. UHCC 0702]|nr:hypothetical protein JYQ62_10135 [Nostoc sp. UHCC 0702]